MPFEQRLGSSFGWFGIFFPSCCSALPPLLLLAYRLPFGADMLFDPPSGWYVHFLFFNTNVWSDQEQSGFIGLRRGNRDTRRGANCGARRLCRGGQNGDWRTAE